MATRDWSQYHEQPIILAHFAGRTGTFLDVGAHAAADNSNTRALMEMGWSGVCVEPSPYVFPELLKNTEPYGFRVLNLNAAVDATRSIAGFYASVGGDQLSTTEIEHRNKWERDGFPFTRPFWKPTITFADILATFEGISQVNFLNIDTEGSSFRVLRSAPLVEMGVELVCVERFDVDTDNAKPIADYLKGVGYKVVAETAGNVLAAKV